MSPRERMAAAMRHQPVDRVPVMCQLAIGHICINAGCSPVDLWHDTATYVDALCAMRDLYDFDGILVSVPGSDPDWQAKAEGIAAAPEGYEVTWREPLLNYSPYPLGGRTLYRRDDLPEPLAGHVLTPLERVAPDAIDTLAKVPEWMLAPVRDTLRRSAERYSVHGETFSPFDKLVELMGIEAAMLSLMDDPGRARAILEQGLAYAANWGAAQAREGIDAIKISSPYVGGGLLSPRFYDQFVVPYETRLVEALHRAADIPVYTHTCGAIGDRLERMVSTGIDGLECLDPPPLGDVDLADAKRRVGDAVFIKGNIDSVNTLLGKHGEGIRADVENALRAGAGGSGFVLSTACSIAPGVPPTSIHTMVETARSYSVA